MEKICISDNWTFEENLTYWWIGGDEKNRWTYHMTTPFLAQEIQNHPEVLTLDIVMVVWLNTPSL